MLDVNHAFCPNSECRDHQLRGKGNIRGHFVYGKQEHQMLYCTTCKSRFSETRCTALFGLKYSPDVVARIIRATAEGLGVRATARLLGLDKDAVNRVILRVGTHCERLLDELLTGLGLTEVQLDELWTFVGKKTVPRLMQRKLRAARHGSGRGSTPKPV